VPTKKLTKEQELWIVENWDKLSLRTMQLRLGLKTHSSIQKVGKKYGLGPKPKIFAGKNMQADNGPENQGADEPHTQIRINDWRDVLLAMEVKVMKLERKRNELKKFFFRGRGFIFSGFHRQARGG